MKKLKLYLSLVVFALSFNAGVGQSITTLFASNNGGAGGGAVYYDVTIGPADLDIISFDINTADAGAISMDVYTIPGTSVGNETNMALWTLVGSGTGTGAGLNNPSAVTLASSFTLLAGTSYGIALVLDIAHGHDYTNGNGPNQMYSNPDISVSLGQASNAPFTGGVFTPRVWNGTIYYGPAGPPPGLTHPSGTSTVNFVVDCSATINYYDSGGADCDNTGGEYGNNENSTSIICPDLPGYAVHIEFLDMDTETRGSPACWDFLTIHDGNSIGSPVLFNGCGEEGFDSCSGFPGDGGDGGGVEGGPNDMNASASGVPANANNIWTSSDATGCLTINFQSDSSVQEGGWIAEVSCEEVIIVDPPACTPFSLDGAFCDPCVAPGQGSSLACGAGINQIISPIDVSGVVGTVTLESIDFNQDFSGSPNPGTLTLNLHCAPGAGPVPYTPNDVPFYSEVFTVLAGNEGMCVNLPLATPQPIDASCGSIWVEIFTSAPRVVHTPAVCDGNVATGTNTWLIGPACGITTPLQFAAIGFALDASYSANFTCDLDCETDGVVLSVSSCMCGFDPSIGNIGALVNYSVSGGTGPYTVTTDFGTLENSSPAENAIYNLYLGAAGGTFTVTVTDANGCSDSFINSCDECVFEPAMVTDPCSCNNDQSYNGAEDGTFQDVVEIVGPGGINLIVGAGSTGLNVPVGTPIPQVAPNLYRIMFNHTDLVGYTLFVEGVANGITFPIFDAAGNQLTATNTCMYPVITEPVIDMVDFCNNGDPLQFTGNEVTEIHGFSGNVSVYVGSETFGDLVTEFDPTLYANGIYILTFVFNGDFVSNTGTQANPGFPGCKTSVNIQIGVGGGDQLTCNDHINMSVNNDCDVDFSWYTLMEDDAVPNVFDGVFTDSAGNVIDESDLGSYIGRTITYAILDLCNGNSCWGTITIEDKSAPEIACDCPVGGEDLDGDGTIDGYAEDCTLTCWELPLLKEGYWDNLRDDLVPEDVGDFIDDNVTSVCDDVTESDVSYWDEYEDLGCNGSLMRRTWTVTYDKGNGVAGSISCTKEYYFQPVGLETIDTAMIDPITGLVVVSEDSIRWPFHLVEMDCSADISPAGIAAYFDIAASEDQDTNDDNIDPDELDIDRVIESNEGIVYAYPHYYIQGRNPAGPHAQAINNEICSLISAYTDQEIESCAPGCAGNRKVLRQWTILDWCESTFLQYEQVIKAVDQGAPFIEVKDISVSVDPWKCAADVLLPHPEHLRDGCDGELTYWIGSVEGGLTVSGNATDGYVLHDALEGQSVSVEYVTEDCCGNRAAVDIQVEVVDLTAPVPVTKEFIVISLTNIGNPEDEGQGIAKLFAVDVDNGSYDSCTGVIVEVRRVEVHCEEFDTDTEWGDHVKFCCSDLDGQAFVEIDVEFKVTDENGNANYSWSTVRLEDKSGTTQICPMDLVLTCDMDYNDFTMTGLPQSFSACGEIDLMCDPNDLIEDTEPRRKGPNDGFFDNPLYDGVAVAAYDPSCGFGAVRRQFRSCSSCVQWFVIEPIDAFDANTIVWPGDQTVDCDGFDTGEPSWVVSTCNLVGVTLASDTFLFEDGACFKILNHWSIINWCIYDASNPNGGGRYDYTQIIKIIDTQDPEMMVEDSLCFGVDADCLSYNVQLSGTATDDGDCASDWLKWEVNIDLYSNWNMDYLFGTSLPRLVNGVTNPYHIAPTGNGEAATITLPDGIETSKVWHRAIWRAYDGCGNNVSSVRYFQITDKKAPTPYCLNLSTAVMSGSGSVELWAIDFNVGSFDNCTDDNNLIYTFTDVAPPARDDSEYDSTSDLMWYNGTFWYYNSETGEYEDQDDYGDEVHRFEPGLRSAGKIFTIDDADASGFVQIPIYVWDECGNADFCLVNLRLIDNMGVGEGRISGQVVTEKGAEVEGVMTELMGVSPEYPVYNMTNANGEYAFYNVPFFTNYQVSGTSNSNYLNGVSTLDLVFIQRHILGIEMLDSPYKMIAADINNDKLITAIDLIELRKLILGIYPELPNNGSWKTVDASQELTLINPWIYNESLNINDLNSNMTEEDFIGVKVGDVNNTAVANINSGANVERNSGIELTYNDRYVNEGTL